MADSWTYMETCMPAVPRVRSERYKDAPPRYPWDKDFCGARRQQTACSDSSPESRWLPQTFTAPSDWARQRWDGLAILPSTGHFGWPGVDEPTYLLSQLTKGPISAPGDYLGSLQGSMPNCWRLCWVHLSSIAPSAQPSLLPSYL